MFYKTFKWIKILAFVVFLIINSNVFSQTHYRCGTLSSVNLSKIGTGCNRPIYKNPVFNHNTTHFRIHYTLTGEHATTSDYVQNLGNYAGTSWNVECNILNWRTPSNDGVCGGDNKYDIYIRDTYDVTTGGGYFGMTVPEDLGDYSNSVKSYIVIDNNLTDNQIKATVAHEFNHSVQFSYNGNSTFISNNIWIYESTATWIEDIVYDDVNDWIITFLFDDANVDDPLSHPHYPITHTNRNYHYGTALFCHLLSEWKNDNLIIRRIWERNGEVDGSAVANTNYILTTYYATDLITALKKYAEWRYFTGNNDDGNHFSEASSFPTPTITTTHNNLPASNNYSVSSPGGARFVLFNPASAGISIYFNGQAGYDWKALAIINKTSGSNSIIEYSLNGNMEGSVSSKLLGVNSIVLTAVASEYNQSISMSFSYNASNLPSSAISFWNESGTNNLGGQLKIDEVEPVNSGESRNLVTNYNYYEETLMERTNYLSKTYKHNNWNTITTDQFLDRTFTVQPGGRESAKFLDLNYTKITLNSDGAEINGGSLDFQDPWYVKSDGSQPGNFWIPAASPYEPNGKAGAIEKGVFLNQLIESGKPYYTVRVPSQQTINIGGTDHTFYFQNWSASPAVDAEFQNANSTETAVVFKNANVTVNANLKGTHLSGNPSAFSNNNQNKFIKADGAMYQVYESMGRVWLERSTNNGSSWEILNNTQPIDVYNGRYPSLAHFDSGNQSVVVVYLDDAYGYQVRVKVFQNGSPVFEGVAGDYTYDFSVSSVSQPVAAYNYNGRLMVVWNHNGYLYYRYGQILSNSIQWYNSEPTLVSGSGTSSTRPILAKDSGLDFYLAW